MEAGNKTHEREISKMDSQETVSTWLSHKLMRSYSSWVVYMATGVDDGKAILWNVTTGKQIRTFEGHTDLVTSACISGDRLVTGSRSSFAVYEINIQINPLNKNFTSYWRTK